MVLLNPNKRINADRFTRRFALGKTSGYASRYV